MMSCLLPKIALVTMCFIGIVTPLSPSSSPITFDDLTGYKSGDDVTIKYKPVTQKKRKKGVIGGCHRAYCAWRDMSLENTKRLSPIDKAVPTNNLMVTQGIVTVFKIVTLFGIKNGGAK